jgi:aspartokinase
LEDIAKIVFQYGGTVIMAVLFIFIYLDDRKNYKEEKKNNVQVLSQLAASTNNVAESLNLLKTSMDHQNNKFQVHDERDIKNFSDIKEQLTRIESGVSK